MRTCEVTTINEMRKKPPKGNQHAQGSNLGRTASTATCSEARRRKHMLAFGMQQWWKQDDREG